MNREARSTGVLMAEAERMKGGHYSFVQCRIRIATGATPG